MPEMITIGEMSIRWYMKRCESSLVILGISVQQCCDSMWLQRSSHPFPPHHRKLSSTYNDPKSKWQAFDSSSIIISF
ncbi:hypothetical protein CEXT_629811 [Caerostris extrusa]|uniref:Uncharacterized protein n=1 Tax=Caerostris extrusa TaxID=172846 RepID=A0AAV4NJI3_CAEEX|nr:hypothetical protein CEXT_629811 [Caerostris extrusa]